MGCPVPTCRHAVSSEFQGPRAAPVSGGLTLPRRDPIFFMSCVKPLHSRVDSTTPVAWSQDTSPEPCKRKSFRLGENPHFASCQLRGSQLDELAEGLIMSNINEESSAADADRSGDAKPARQGLPEGGNVVAFRPKPARAPNSHPPPPPTAA
jgi:hypothetical protein